MMAPPSHRRASLIVALAVFSHWVLDFIVHRPDLPLYDNAHKVGLGLWDFPVLALALEIAALFGGMLLCLRGSLLRSPGTLLFGVVMIGIQAYVFFGPPPTSDRVFAITAIFFYVVFAAAIWWLQDHRAEHAPEMTP